MALAQSAPDILRGWLTGAGGLPQPLAESPWRGAWQVLYAGRRHAPLWFADTQPGERLPQLAEALEGLPTHGIALRKADRILLEEVRGLAETPLSASRVAELELRLTDRLFGAAAQLQTGQTAPAKMDPQWHLEVPTFDPKPLIAGLQAGEPVPQLLERMSPQAVGYQRLRQTLAEYRKPAAGEWGMVPDGPSLRPGEESEVVAPLRERLVKGGDLEPAAAPENPNLYDPELEAAVKRFQERHGLDPDGVVGKRTRTALNATRAGRIAQLRAVLERWRWLPHGEGARYVQVNTAGFLLSVHRPGREPLEMRVIAGLADKKWSTPSFGSTIRQVELNPYWNIPDSILREEILEATREDPEYLARKNIRAIGADGEEMALTAEQLHADLAAGAVDYRLRQDSGGGNALGRIKLLLPNRFGIYLHDTPRRHLFKRSYRAMSHGCIRLERPYDLAAELVGGEWNAAKLEETAAQDQRRTLQPRQPVPIRIVYLSAWVDADGTVQFREDHYNRDGRLLATFAE